jgi:hypothetical protein
LQLAKAGAAPAKGARPRPSIAGTGGPVADGWRWTLDLPGQVLSEDIDPARVAAALNRGDRLVAVAEITHAGDGWADLSCYRTDPLAGALTPPWKPGSLPSCVKPGEVCLGRQRNGEHMHMTAYDSIGAHCALFAGRRGSGKSETMRLGLAQMVAWGNVRPIVIDVVRQGVDFATFGVEVVTDMKTALDVVKAVQSECKQRAVLMRQQGKQKLTPTKDMPVLAVIIDEVHAVLGNPAALKTLADFARESRPTLGLLWACTQYPTRDVIAPTLRMQLANRWCGKVSTIDEARVVLGDNLPEGVGPHLLRLGPGGCVVDFDGAERVTGRTWNMTPGWLAAHMRELNR